MGLSAFFLPERLPRQLIYAGDRHAEIVRLQNGRIVERQRVEGAALAENADAAWAGIAAALRTEDAGIVFNAAPFIYNFFEFDKLPWQKKTLRDLVTWRLQKIFPENIDAYDHRFFRLDGKRVLSILVKKTLLEKTERLFAEKRVPLTYIGNSTVEILSRSLQAKSPPDFFLESDQAGCTLVFQSRRSPIYIRKFKSASVTDTVDEITKTVNFVRNNYSIDPRRYWLIEHRDEGFAATMEEQLAGADFFRLRTGPGAAPHLPARP
ncbi:MAG TPA: hypothetical protein VF451_09200 [Acidobacteriota bacterium]